MMGEYILYCQGKVFGGIYDDRFLVKPTKSALTVMSDVKKESPYEGAKEMILVDNLDDRAILKDLVRVMVPGLPAIKIY